MAKCKYGDPTCPCQDGDLCHYEGKNAWKPPDAFMQVQMQAISLATKAGQTIGEDCSYYVTLAQLEEILMEIRARVLLP